MQNLASELSKIFRRQYPRTLAAGGAISSRTQHPARPLAGRGAPCCWNPNLGPPQLFSSAAVVASLHLTNHRMMKLRWMYT